MECDKCGYSDNGTGDMAHHCGGIKNLTMTNTPMTFDEWFASTRFSTLKNNVQKMCAFNCGDEAWQASQAQQSSVIAELEAKLDELVKFQSSSVSMAETISALQKHVGEQAQTIAELLIRLNESIAELDETSGEDASEFINGIGYAVNCIEEFFGLDETETPK